MKKLLSLIIGLFTLLPLCAQVDTQFWFAVPTLSQHSAQASYHLMVFAQEQAADVVITMPANSSFSAIKAHIDANGYKDIVIAADYTTAQSIFAVPYNQVSQRALNITSNAPIYCYCQITHYNGEAYTLKGRSALGTEFYVLSQHSLQNAPESDQAIYKEAYNSVEILATENNTQVTIAPSNNVGLACTTTPFTVTLNRGETYAFKACTKTAAGHLVGTKITSNRPIAVNSTDDSVYETNYAGADLCGDQLTPTDSWGKEYIAVGNNAWYECLTILAKEDNTVVNLDDGTSFTLNTGDVKDVPMSTVSTRYVRSNKPIGVWQMTGNIQESGGTNLPGLRCTGSREVKYQRTTGTVSTYIHIVTETVNINDFTLNGSPIAASKFYTVNGTNGDYSYASINVSSVSSGLIEVQCSSGPFHMAAIDNIATSGSGITSCTYGYFSAYNTSRQSSTTAVFQEGKSYIWEGHFEADGVTPMVFTKDGVYRDTVPTDGACDSICILYLSMSPCPPMEVRPDTTINAGDSARLWATGRDFYVWSPTTTIAEQDEQKYAVPTFTTTYTVTGYNNPDDESANLVINGSFEDGNTGFETDLDYVSGYSPQGQYGNYGIKERVNQFWNSNKANTSTRAYEGTMMMVVDGATTANARVWEQQVTVQPHTYYTFSAQVMSCLASNTHGQYALLQFEVNGEQIGAIFHSPTVLYEWNRYSQMWYSGENTTATLTILNQNTDSKGNDFAMDDIRFEGMSTQCQATKTVTITVQEKCPTPKPDLSVRADTAIHKGSSVKMWAEGADVVRWSPETDMTKDADGVLYAQPEQTTIYTATGYNLQPDAGNSVVVNGDFEDGNTGFTTGMHYIAPRPGTGGWVSWGEYTVTDEVGSFWDTPDVGYAYGGSGQMMVIDGATTANSIIWQQTVPVMPHTYYAFSTQVMSCLISNQTGHYALLQFSVNNEQLGEVFHSPTELYQWARYYEVWYSGENTSALLTILNQNTDGLGNDFAIDAVHFEPLTPGCEAVKTVTITVLKECSKDSTFLKPVICVNDLPYTHPETGVIYYEDAVSRRDIISEKDQYGCDSIIVVDMTILPQPTGDTTAYFYASRPFVWHETTYAVAGDYPYLYPSERAPVCDSLVTLHLIEKTDCAPMEATVQVSDICADAKTMPVEIRLMSEEIGEMTLQFTNAPLNTMPFRDTTIVIDNYTSGQTMTIEVEVPQDAMDITRYPRPDEYTMQVVLRDYCNNVKALDKQTFTVLYPSWITEQHWDDVIAIVNDKHNGGYTFSQVAWLRDGEVISGEEKLYLYLPHDLWTDEDHQTQSDHQYQALLTRSDDGKTVLSCPITPRRINNTDMMTGNKPYVDVTPTRVPVAYPTVHIMTNTTGTYQVMNMAGTVLQRQDYKPCEHGAMDITLPNSSGMYMIVFMPKDADKPLQDKYRVVRIIVE